MSLAVFEASQAVPLKIAADEPATVYVESATGSVVGSSVATGSVVGSSVTTGSVVGSSVTTGSVVGSVVGPGSGAVTVIVILAPVLVEKSKFLRSSWSLTVEPSSSTSKMQFWPL